ncbi:class I SAM-dependent methyltransferase [Paraurantiacibacter namhicola]|uniref:Class I SAM-dependent methyltransferase n=1 Tax=Paraurantiacibacter namhicola TaxID=645517 RepID=A0A1C7DB27_9SPHN|nr:class I SAM-dependent methyltransferase [Paraurantiacibacter namhicola]ANU08617.1 hypothetical protein A6F65_02334 [Paraurantiacibacter namhicola]
MVGKRSLTDRLADLFLALLVRLIAPLLRAACRRPADFPALQKAADRARVQLRSTHYYHPTYADADLPADVTQPRDLPGLDLDEAGQLALLERFDYAEELSQFAAAPQPGLAFHYGNGNFGEGDADALYAMIRTLKPRRLVEIGSGFSTRMAAAAIAHAARTDDAYRCDHTCIEPYEMRWLEELGVNVVRERVEDVDRGIFDSLQAGDMLFIDSSHVIRPFGDVLTEYQRIIPRLAKGVVVHVHDVFTPRDYPERWLREERRLWNEQYLLETMLAHSPRYRVLLALNWLHHAHPERAAAAFPGLARRPDAEPGSLWFEVAA